MTSIVNTMEDEFRSNAQSLLKKIGGAERVRKFRKKTPSFDKSVWESIAQAGWISILLSEKDGGLGLGIRELMPIMEEIGKQLLPEPFIGAGIQAISILSAIPASPIRDQLLTDAVSGKKIIGVAWQEMHNTLSLTDCQLSSEYFNGNFYITGKKEWVAPGSSADGWLVIGEDNQLFWVEKDSSTEITDLPRVDDSCMANLYFKNSKAFPIFNGAFVETVLDNSNDIARLAQSAELLGIAKQCLNMTLEYLKTRIQFGKPIGSNQALQHRIVDAYIQVEIASACLQEVVAKLEKEPGKLSELSSRAKARCANVAITTTRLAIQFHGAIGFTDEFNLGLYWKRAVHLNSWLGNVSAHKYRHFKLLQEDVKNIKLAHSSAQPSPETNWSSMSEIDFRNAVRAFLHSNYPTHLRNAPRRVRWHEIKDWYFALSKQGWIAPAWPKEFGGMELPPDLLLSFIEEFEDFGAARLPDQGLINLGPVLIQHGNDEQKRKWLPKILSGENIWCQGYSEPNAGSDLASLRTEAVLKGDHFVVNGQKIWTTLAHDATHIFLLVRTDKNAKKQAGISFLLADLKTPGITVRPIPNIAGEEEFCEVFFDNVSIPSDNLVGNLNEGWAIAKSLLGFERLFVGSPKTCRHALGLLKSLSEKMGIQNDSIFFSELADLQLELSDLQAAYSFFADIVKQGKELPASVSLLKIFATETYTRIASKILEISAEHGGTRRELELFDSSIEPIAPLFTATITTIYGGSNEIQRNILARHVLELPN